MKHQQRNLTDVLRPSIELKVCCCQTRLFFVCVRFADSQGLIVSSGKKGHYADVQFKLEIRATNEYFASFAGIGITHFLLFVLRLYPLAEDTHCHIKVVVTVQFIRPT